MNEKKEAKSMGRKLAFGLILESVSCRYNLAQDILA